MDCLASGVELPNMFDDTILHTHRCKNCLCKFWCADPLCGDSMFDPELCPACVEALEGIWHGHS